MEIPAIRPGVSPVRTPPPAAIQGETPPGDCVTLGAGEDAAAPPSPQPRGVSAQEAASILFERRAVGGETTWKVHFEDGKGPGRYTPVRLDDGTIVVNGRKGTYGFHPDGTQAWHLETGDCGYRPPVTGRDGTLYLRSGNGKLYAVRADANGAQVAWEKPVGKRGASANPVLDARGRLYVADDDRRLHVFEPDGREVDHVDWEHLMSEEPTVLPDGRLVLKGYDGYQAVFNPEAGSFLGRLFHGQDPRLERIIHAEVLRPTGVGPDGSTYEVADRKTIRVLEPDGKTVRWEHSLDVEATSVHVALRPDGTVLALSGNEMLTAISPEGKRLWTWKPDGAVEWDYVMDAGGTAYFTGSGGNWKAYAVGSDGQPRWTTDLGSHGGNAALGPLDTLLVEGDMAPLRVLDRSTGQLIHEAHMDLAFGGQPVVAMEDGTLVAASEHGDLVGIRISTPESTAAEASRQAARAATMASGGATAPTSPEIRHSEGCVVIGGVRVPVRR